jgi:NifU-like protein involved in Fe-S cluster formation
MKYNDITRRYFDAAANAGTLQGEDVLRGSAGDLQGPCWVQFDVRVQHRMVSEARFQAFGCPHTIAICGYLAESAAGKPTDAALPQSLEPLMHRFSVPEEKRGRLLVIEDAWRAAVGRQR